MDTEQTKEKNMDKKNEELEAFQLMRNANRFSSELNYGKALRVTFQAIQLFPDILHTAEQDLSFYLQEYSKELFQGGHFEKVKWLYSRALQFCPGSSELRHNLGAFCSLAGHQMEALALFQEVLHENPNFWPAHESIANVKSLAVDRWHFRMLNDQQRNSAYDAAITEAIKGLGEDGKVPVTVLDIGTGTGILTLMALRAGASRVYACETNATLCEVATECIRRAGYLDRVKIINKSSLDLVVGIDLENKVDLVVTELVDSGLVGEHIVPTLQHANAFLLKKRGKVIPHRAEVYGVLIECSSIRYRSRLVSSKEQENVITALLGDPPPVQLRPDEPYTCEDLESLPHQKITDEKLLSTVHFIGAEKTPTTVQWDVQESGCIDAVALWFTLFLLEDSDSFTITTCPGRENCGWDQAIYFHDRSTVVDKGRILSLGISLQEDRFVFALESTSESATIMDEDGALLLGEMDIAQLNDCHRFQLYKEEILQAVSEGHDVVLDFCSSWSLLGLIAVSCGATKVTSFSQNTELIQVTSKLAELAQISPKTYEAYNCSVVEGGMSKVSEKANLLVADVVEGCGLIRQQVLGELIFARDFLSVNQVKIVPNKLSLVVQCIHCAKLVYQNAVRPENTVGLDISAVNSFSLSHIREVDLSCLNFVQMSKPVLTILLDLENITASEQGLFDETTVSVPIIASGCVNAVSFWFQTGSNYNPKSIFESTGPCFPHQMKNNCSFFRQAVELIEPHIVSELSVLEFKISWSFAHGIFIQNQRWNCV